MRITKAGLVYTVGVIAYLVAVMQRSSLGVAVVDADVRFGVSAAALSILAVSQLIVYAGLQIPVGVLIDRLGSTVLLVAGTTVMGLGQIGFALATDLGQGILARLLVGAGDAAIFASVLRLIPAWFPGERVPILQQWTGNIGQLGQVLSAIPFAILLGVAGWTPAFIAAGATSLLVAVLIVLVIRDAPAGATSTVRVGSWATAFRQLGRSLRQPGTRLGFWSHFVTQSSGTMFTLLWGFPFLILGLGLSRAQASAYILIIVATGIIVGPILGLLTARFPFRRSNLVLGIVALLAVAWSVVLFWPGTPPNAAIVFLLIALGIGGPGSMIGFDFARTFNPSRSLGVANGVVNVGGFLASFTMMFLIGLGLDAGSAGTQTYTLEAFRLAFLIQYPVIGAGVVGLLLARRRTRRRIEEEDGITVGPLWRAIVDRARRR